MRMAMRWKGVGNDERAPVIGKAAFGRACSFVELERDWNGMEWNGSDVGRVFDVWRAAAIVRGARVRVGRVERCRKYNTPPQARQIPKVCECNATLCFGSAFVRMSAVMSSVGQYLMLINLSAMHLRMKWYRMSICLVRA